MPLDPSVNIIFNLLDSHDFNPQPHTSHSVPVPLNHTLFSLRKSDLLAKPIIELTCNGSFVLSAMNLLFNTVDLE